LRTVKNIVRSFVKSINQRDAFRKVTNFLSSIPEFRVGQLRTKQLQVGSATRSWWKLNTFALVFE